MQHYHTALRDVVCDECNKDSDLVWIRPGEQYVPLRWVEQVDSPEGWISDPLLIGSAQLKLSFEKIVGYLKLPISALWG